jgi:hypothetical protein
MAEELITSDCFEGKTLDSQLYEILKAIDTFEPNGGIPANHAPSHFTGGYDPIAPQDIGAVPITRSIIAGVGLTGGGDLSANRTIQVLYGTTEGTVCAGNDPRLAGISNSGTISSSIISDFTERVVDIIAVIDAGGY